MEVLVLIFIARRGKLPPSQAHEADPLTDGDVVEPEAMAVFNQMAFDQRVLDQLASVPLHVFPRVIASRPSTWPIEAMMDCVFIAAPHHPNAPKSLGSLGDWVITHLSPRGFNVDAGSFTIEHNSEHTVIRVHDQSRVRI
jgi:hypothetical protein